MKIISFAWTTKALLEGKKTQTRRFWNDKYAKTFRAGQLIQAYDKNPRAGGKPVAIIRLTCDAWKQKLQDLTHRQFLAEGGFMYWKHGHEFIDMMLSQGKGDKVWVLEFELVAVAVHGEKS